MADSRTPCPLARDARAYVLAGGRGTRLMELTDRRAKPAVYFGGKSRIIDFARFRAVADAVGVAVGRGGMGAAQAARPTSNTSATHRGSVMLTYIIRSYRLAECFGGSAIAKLAPLARPNGRRNRPLTIDCQNRVKRMDRDGSTWNY